MDHDTLPPRELSSLVSAGLAARSAPEALVAGEEPVTIDEAQRSPELLLAVKREIDRRRAPGRFLLSGSANLAILDGVSAGGG